MFLVAATACGCGHGLGAGSRTAAPKGSVQPAAVSDSMFAQAVNTLLRNGTPSVDRQALLAGVVRRQLAHATDRFVARQHERGLASVLGALYLIRSGELRPGMIGEEGEKAFALALDVIAATGDEGRSLALYNLRRLAAPAQSPVHRDIDEHIAALQKWVAEVASDMGEVELLGAVERRTVTRALLEPTQEALQAAVTSTARWTDAGLAFDTRFRQNPNGRPKREELIEGSRAVSSAAATLASLYLRNGDAAGAVEAIGHSSVEQVSPPGLIERLQAASTHNKPEDWRILLEIFSHSDSKDDETAVDPELLRAATFGLATEAFRRDATSVEVAMFLAASLAAFGMPEAAPTVLVEAARKHPEPPVLSAMLEAIARTMVHEEESDDPASAHRTFAACSPLLAIADQPALRPSINPSPARVRFVAASIDARAGELSSARSLLTTALQAEPSADGYRLLAEVERQMGHMPAALTQLEKVISSPEAKQDRIEEAEARLFAADIDREMGDKDHARQELNTALQTVAGLCKTPIPGPEVPRAERALARILDRMGDDVGASHASERALTASENDPHELAFTILEAMERAFVQRNVTSARWAAHQALKGNLRDDDLVYVGIWLQSLERELGVRTDGTAAEVLGSIQPGPTWAGRLAVWADGKLTDTELLAAARTPGQRTEALFYRALARRALGDTKGAEPLLRQVTQSSALELMEEQLARDLLAGADRRIPGAAPTVNITGCRSAQKTATRTRP